MAAERARAKSLVSTDEHQQPFELSLFSEGDSVSAIEKEDQTKVELDPEIKEMNPSVLQQQRYSSSDEDDEDETSSSDSNEEDSQSSGSSR